MILRRLGNKKNIASKIQEHFPPHKIWVEPFFGAGGMFFNKPKAKHNIVNDNDSDVFNLFQVVMDRKEELKEAFYIMPIHSDLFNYWKENKEIDPIKKAIRFLFLSNLTFMGHGNSLRIGASGGSNKNLFFKKIDFTFDYLYDIQLNNCDFEKFLKDISLDDRTAKGETDKTLIYCDPPYLETDNNYKNGFTLDDSTRLFNTLEATGCKFAYSEFDHPHILKEAEKRGLNVIIIGERQNLKNRRVEILVTNYKPQQLKLF